MILSESAELILLFAYLNGNHREDIKNLSADLFQHKELFKAVADGMTFLEFTASNPKERYKISIGELTSVEAYQQTNGTIDVIGYYNAYGEALNVQLSAYSERLKTATAQDYDSIMQRIAETYNAIHDKGSVEKESNLSEMFLAELEEIQSEKNPRYGIKKLDKATRGLHRGQLIILSARPGNGKSALALQIAEYVMHQDYKTLFVPLEMTAYETLQRLIIQEQIVYNSDEANNPTEEQKADIRTYLNAIEKEDKLCLYCGLNNLAELEQKIKTEKPFLVIIDQLDQLASRLPGKEMRDKYIRCTNELKSLALRENICILLVHQLNRDTDNKKSAKKKPGLNNLAESDSVGRDGDVVLLIHRPGEEEEEDDYAQNKPLKECELIVAKNRQGADGVIIPLMFQGERVTFSEVEESKFTPKYKSVRK